MLHRTINAEGKPGVTSNNTSTKNGKKNNGRRTSRDRSTSTHVKRRRKGKYDWEVIRAQFVEGIPTKEDDPDSDREWVNLRELSERTGVAYQQIRARAAEERWTDLRSAYQLDLTRKRQKARIEKLGSESVEFDDQALNIAKIGMRLVGTRMGEIARDVTDRQKLREQALFNRQQGYPIDYSDLRSAIHSTELERLGKSAQMFQEIGMRALGTNVERHEHTGANGEPINIQHHISVVQELERDDPDRLGAFLAAAHNAGVFDQLAALEDEDETPQLEAQPHEEQQGEQVVEAEIVDDDEA